MTKSDKWCLIRLEFFGEFFLNEGDTTIGRNKVADVITPSSICSRNHCVLTLSPDGNIRIKNQSSNGTYVNDKKVENEPCDLKHNDIIGLGCEQSVFNFVEADEKSKYYVFRLFNKSLVREGGVIDLVSDDDDDLKSIQIAANAEANPPSMVEENNDDNELIYSQQVFMEIKQEVNCPNEIVDHEDDFSIYISDDSGDAESNSWVDRLSQDQDLVVKKVTESVQNKKRKITKQIEAIPIVPTKKTRRNPMSSHTKSN